MSVAIVGDPNVCAKHQIPLEEIEYMGTGTTVRGCRKCHHSGSCPTHWKSHVWDYKGATPRESGLRCGICGYWFDGREMPPDDPPTIRTFARFREHVRHKAGQHRRDYYALGMLEEVGELFEPVIELVVAMRLQQHAGKMSGVVKKHEFHGRDLNREKLVEEAGDALWYFDALLDRYGITMEEVVQANERKLSRLYPDGFTPERARARDLPPK